MPDEADGRSDHATGVQAVVEALYSQVRDRIELRDVNPGNVVIMLTYAMTVVEGQKTLTGAEKKEVVVRLVRRLVGEIPADGGDKLALQAAVAILLPPMIDAIVAASRGKLDINKDGDVSSGEVAQATTGCWRGCFPCCYS